jgi:hypothetical protein
MTAHAISLPKVRDYAPYRPGPFKIGMDLNPLDPADWIEIDEQLPPYLAEKERLLARNHDLVFAALPQAEAGARETLAMLRDHLVTHFPEIYHQDQNSITNRVTAESWSIDDDPATRWNWLPGWCRKISVC